MFHFDYYYCAILQRLKLENSIYIVNVGERGQ